MQKRTNNITTNFPVEWVREDQTHAIACLCMSNVTDKYRGVANEYLLL